MPKVLTTVLLIFICCNVRAQSWEVGGFAGGAGYMGDLNPKNPLKISGAAFGALVQRNFDEYFSAKLNYTHGFISAADNTSGNEQARNRNLSFSTNLDELSLIGEFNFMGYIPSISRNVYTPFIYAGVGVVQFNPQTVYMGQTYNLRPLKTEGQASPYTNRALTIPYGIGFKYNFASTWNLAAEIGYRQPKTDYLDDVSGVYANPLKLPNATSIALADRSGESTGVYTGTPGTQRGDLRARDTYLFVGFTISYTFITSKCYY